MNEDFFTNNDAQADLDFDTQCHDDDWYLVELRHIQDGREVTHYGWTRSTSWRVPTSLYPGDGERHHLFRWQVRVVHSQTTDVGDPSKLKPSSPRSEMRTFYWY